MALAGVILALAAGSQAATMSITNSPGWNLIANQLVGDGGNNIRLLIRTAPLGSQLKRFNLATGAFDSTETFQQLPTGGQAWVPGTNILNPGDGLYFYNNSSSNFVMTIAGLTHVPVLPLAIGNATVLVGRQTNEVAAIADILGYKAPPFTYVYQFRPGVGQDPNSFTPANYVIYAMTASGWITPPGAPSNIKIGESVWVGTNGSLPTIVTQQTNQTVCPGNYVVLSGTAIGTAPINYQWRLNGKDIAGATSGFYVIPSAGAADQGTYTVVAANPFGSTTGLVSTVTVADKVPPSIICPTNLTLACRGVQGTVVSYQVSISDNCDFQPSLVVNPPSGSVFFPGTTTVVATGWDASGNTNVCSFTVTILDNKPPTIACPPDRTVVAAGPNGTQVYYTAVATDNCDPNPVVNFFPPSGTLFPIGQTPVTCTAKDSSGNIATCVFNITVAPASCCEGKFWQLPDVGGPGSLAGHAMAYDPNRGRVVLFGGNSAKGLVGNTWEWDGTSWTLMSTSGPTARAFTAMAFHSRLGKVVLFGGYAGAAGTFGDTWTWDGSNWVQLDVTGPAPRFAHAMAYDEARGRLVLYGGVDPKFVEFGDTWEFNGSSWKQVGTSSKLNPRYGHVMAYGVAQRQMLLFGGAQGTNFYGDTWAWDGTSWSQAATAGPQPRYLAAMAYSDTCDTIVLTGGATNSTNPFAETWEWNGKDWKQVDSKMPPARLEHAMAHDSAHGKTVVYGGLGGGTVGTLSDTRLYGSDFTPPAVLSVYTACGDQRIVIAFDKPVSAVSAQNTNNYALVCGGVITPVLAAVLTADPRVVWLYAAQPISSGCALIINGIQDLCGHPLRLYQTGFECRPEPCARGSAGTEFWLTFPGNYAPDPTNPPQPQLFVAGTAGTVGAAALPALSPPFFSFFTIPASGVATITLPSLADLGNANDVIQSNGVVLVASQPVSVYGMNHIRYTTDAYLGLSTRGIGQAYLVMAYRNMFTGVPELNGSQFAIAASQDNTKVLVMPPNTIGGHPGGVPFALTLSRGQTYQLRDTNDAPADVSGTIIVADKPISVFGSHQCADIPNNNCFFCDYVVEQLPPVDQWGNRFITRPLATRFGGDTFRFMALFNGTTVSVNGVPIPGLLDQGKYYETQIASAAQILSDKPILVAQYANSSDFDFVANSDPFMVIVPPTSVYFSSYMVQTPVTDFGNNYLNLTVSTGSVSQIVLDGSLLSSALFSPVGGSGYASARVAVGLGPHALYSADGSAFGVIAYGWSLYDSYGYPAANCGFNKQVTPRFTCPPEALSVSAGAGCLGAVPDLVPYVGNAGQALMFTQDPVAGTLLPPGTYQVNLFIVDQLGQRHPCTTALTITPATGSGLACPQNIVTNCASGAGQYVNYSVSICNSNYSLVCTPPPGGLFPPGTTTVDCKAVGPQGLVDECRFNITVNCARLGTTLSGTNITISWSGNGVLQKAATLAGPWITVSNAPNPFRTFTSGQQGYFRLMQ